MYSVCNPIRFVLVFHRSVMFAGIEPQPLSAATQINGSPAQAIPAMEPPGAAASQVVPQFRSDRGPPGIAPSTQPSWEGNYLGRNHPFFAPAVQPQARFVPRFPGDLPTAQLGEPNNDLFMPPGPLGPDGRPLPANGLLRR